MSEVRKRIGTHDGLFHCDEVLACFLLKKLPEYIFAEIIRTRDMSILKTCDIVVDVGGVYDVKTNRFDHHQKDFKSTMNSLDPSKPWTIKLSSAGLVYFHFGERIFRSILGPFHDAEIIPPLFDYIYENFVQEIDAIDNGVSMCETEPKFRIHTSLSSRVSHLNPAWNNTEPIDSLKLFHNAMDLTGREFIDQVQYFLKSWWPARDVVKNAILNRSNVHSSEEIIELEQACPWVEHLLQYEKENDIVGLIKFVIFKNESWKVQAVPVAPSSFECRVFLLEEWRAIRDEELSKISGIDGCIFVHSSGYIGGNKTREGALLMAEKSLSSQVSE